MSYLYENLGRAIDDREGTTGNRRVSGGRSGSGQTTSNPIGNRPVYIPPKPIGGKPKPANTKPATKNIYGTKTGKPSGATSRGWGAGSAGPIIVAPATPAAVLAAPIVTPPPAATQAPAYGGYPSSGGGGGGSSYVPPSTEPAENFPEDTPAPNTEASTKPSGGMSTTTLVLIGLGLYLLTRSKP